MTSPTIFVVSGGAGTSGNQLVRTALAQFPTADVSVTIVPQVRQTEQLAQVIAAAAAVDGIVVHTLVDETLRRELVHLAKANQVVEIDLVGTLLNQLVGSLGQKPLEQPGLYRKMCEQDLKRIEAIEFAVDHDDGKRAHELSRAEIVLTGVSRVGKTPLSMYLSTMGWKVANVPLVKGVNPPSTLFEIDSRRVVGLMIEAGQLVAYRRQRGHHLGIAESSTYTAPTELVDELEFAREVFRRGRFAVVDTTDKPIEESASEIIGHINRRLVSN